MILNSPYISGSLTVTGNIITSGSITISGSIASASYAVSASEASKLQGLGSASFAPASTFNTVSQSYAASSASLSTRVTNEEATSSVLTSASSSFATMSGSLSTRVTNLESTSSTVSQSFASTSGSISGRVTLIEGQYATTGSNTFTGPQYVSQASNAISFTSTASLYTDGGLRVAKDSFVSGTAYFNNITVYGTSSIEYITSSQVNIGSNIITVNTDTPAIRFGGLSVFDSGSTGLTGSLFWDSEKNHWIYSNPSGSSYNSAMLMNGPRNTGSLGDEQGTTNNALMKGQGGDHITSSQMIDDGTTVQIPGNLQVTGSLVNTGAATFSSSALISGVLTLSSTISNGTYTYTLPSATGTLALTSALSDYLPLTGGTLTGALVIGNFDGQALKLQEGTATGNTYLRFYSSAGGALGYLGSFNSSGTQYTLLDGSTTDLTLNGYANLYLQTVGSTRLTIASTGAATFSSSVQAASLSVVAGTNAAFSFAIDQQSTFAFGSTNGKRVAVIRDANVADNGLQFGYDTVDKTGIIAGAATSAGCGIDFYTFNGSSWGNRMRVTKDGNLVIGTSSDSTLGSKLRILGSINITGTDGYNGWAISQSGGNSNAAFNLGYAAGGATNVITAQYDTGYVGIGTSSPDQKLTVNQGATGTGQGIPATTGTTQNGILRLRPAIGVYGETFDFGMNVASTYAWMQATNASGLGTNYAIAINPNGGNVGIGTSAPSYLLEVAGFTRTQNLRVTTDIYLERTSVSPAIVLDQADIRIVNQATGDSNTLSTQPGYLRSSSGFYANTGGSAMGIGSISGARRLQWDDSLDEVMVLGSNNGYKAIGASAFNVRSDYRLKEDLKESSGLNEVLKIKTYNFKWIDSEERQDGFIAHELADVLPYVVTGRKDGIREDETIIAQGVDYSKLVPILVKAIQEQQAQIEALKARIETLEK